MWDGCNECHVVIGTDTGIYATFVMRVVAEEDQSRVVWPSCPAPGWTAGVDRLYGMPNGSPLGLLPASSEGLVLADEVGSKWGTKIETHGPYQHGGGFPSVNGLQSGGAFPSNIPFNLTKAPVGITQVRCESCSHNSTRSPYGCFMYPYHISCESCSHFDSLPLTSLARAGECLCIRVWVLRLQLL